MNPKSLSILLLSAATVSFSLGATVIHLYHQKKKEKELEDDDFVVSYDADDCTIDKVYEDYLNRKKNIAEQEIKKQLNKGYISGYKYGVAKGRRLLSISPKYVKDNFKTLFIEAPFSDYSELSETKQAIYKQKYRNGFTHGFFDELIAYDTGMILCDKDSFEFEKLRKGNKL